MLTRKLCLSETPRIKGYALEPGFFSAIMVRLNLGPSQCEVWLALEATMPTIAIVRSRLSGEDEVWVAT